MKIAILLPKPVLSGGHMVVFEHASFLQLKGHEVTMVTEQPVETMQTNWHPGAQNLTWSTFESLSNDGFDIAIATWWQTAFFLHRLAAKCYVYFVQSIESKFYEHNDNLGETNAITHLCESTYFLPVAYITEANWIAEYLRDKYNLSAELVRNGVRKDIFFEGGDSYPKERGKLRILVEGRLDLPFKNVKKAVQLCNQASVDEVWLLTTTKTEHLPGVDRVFSCVPLAETAKIYRSCDLLVKLSQVEGMFGPPLEMFHCGGTAIVYDVTGHEEYIQHGKNALVVKTGQEQEVIDNIKRLKSNPELLRDLKAGAKKTANDWYGWDQASMHFEKVLIKFFNNGSPRRDLLAQMSKHFLELYQIELRLQKLKPIEGVIQQSKNVVASAPLLKNPWTQKLLRAFYNRAKQVYRRVK